ncbi:MAG: hypothetical protein HYS81_01145 [Candidatus Aenigmatarchaeota archaeon]|nr:MAG: hypothetical protein HYS81_01145 [Candidatus Aenigmarchaeota archaeon]
MDKSKPMEREEVIGVRKDLEMLGLTMHGASIVLSLAEAPAEGITAAEICDLSRRAGANIFRTKVYSEISKLEEKGLVLQTGGNAEYAKRFCLAHDYSETIGILAGRLSEPVETARTRLLASSRQIQNGYATDTTGGIGTITSDRVITRIKHETLDGAEEEILLMIGQSPTSLLDRRSGDIVRSRARSIGVKCLLAEPGTIKDAVNRRRCGLLEKSLETAGVDTGYHEPRSLEMIVADSEEALVFVYPSGMMESMSPAKVLFSTGTEFARDMRDLFLSKFPKAGVAKESPPIIQPLGEGTG